MSAHVLPPVNLIQIGAQLETDWPDRQLPDGWGLVASTRDGVESISDPFGVFSDQEIHDAYEQVVYDPDFGSDPDYLWLRDHGIAALDVLINSPDAQLAELAKIVRARFRQPVTRPDSPPTF